MSRNKHLTKLYKEWLECPLILIVPILRLCCYSYQFKAVFTADDKQLIKSSRQLEGYSSQKFLQEFPQRNWTRRGLNCLLAKIDRPKHGTAGGRGWPCTACTADNVVTVEELVRSQKDKPQKHTVVRETAREIGIQRSTVHRIIRKDLACRQCRVCCSGVARNLLLFKQWFIKKCT